MPNFNIVYQKGSANQVLSALPSDVQIITHLEKLHVLTVEAANDTALREIPGVIGVGLDEQLTAEIATEPWHKLRICSSNLPMRTEYITKNTGSDVVVYLVDSGVNIIGDLETANIENLHSFDGTFNDTLNHGTGVASLIVGTTLGVSKDAHLKIVKIPMNVAVNVSTLLTAFDAILSDHILTPDVKVVNCSWVIAKNEILDLKIQELQNEGLLVVAAAGNTVSNANDYSPVGLDTVLGVAASDAYDRVVNWGPGSGSNWGTEVDITAPGIDVDVLNNDGTIITTSGTSLAAAVVSGAAAQFIVEHPTYTAQQIQTEIITKAGMDLLFRNESVYGTTPNVLLRIPYYGDIFEGTPSSAEAKKGETTRVAITAHTVVATITIDDIIINGSLRPPYDWVSFDIESKELIFSPTVDVPTAKYVVMYAGKNANAELISNGVILVDVFNLSPAENVNNETYFNKVENGVVVVKPAFCVAYVSCPNGNECFDDGKGGTCYCGSGTCADA
jgi:hypothetical protein